MSLELKATSEAVLRQLAQLLSDLEHDPPPVAHTVTIIVTAIESYTDKLIRALVDESGVQAFQFGQALIAEAQREFHDSWPGRYQWLSRGFNIQLKGTKVVQDFEVVVDLRNAIFHGGGSLTERQKSDLKSMVALEQRLDKLLKVESGGAPLRFHEDTARRAVGLGRDLVLEIDERVRALYPKLKF